MTAHDSVPGSDDPSAHAVAAKALELISDGARVGLGSGRAASVFIAKLGTGARELRVSGVPTSQASLMDNHRPSRFSREVCPGMHGVFDRAELRRVSRYRRAGCRLPSASPYSVGAPECTFAAEYPACPSPCQRFAVGRA